MILPSAYLGALWSHSPRRFTGPRPSTPASDGSSGVPHSPTHRSQEVTHHHQQPLSSLRRVYWREPQVIYTPKVLVPAMSSVWKCLWAGETGGHLHNWFFRTRIIEGDILSHTYIQKDKLYPQPYLYHQSKPKGFLRNSALMIKKLPP